MRQNRCIAAMMVLLALTLVGCHHQEAVTISPSAFVGAWNGPWVTAGESGTLAINVTPGGNFSGTLIDATQNVTTPITGAISQGVLLGKFMMKGATYTIKGPVSVSEEGLLTGAVDSFRDAKHSAHATLKLSRSAGAD